MLLTLYRGLTGIVAPLVPWMLSRREARGKEDPVRRAERFGVAILPPARLLALIGGQP